VHWWGSKRKSRERKGVTRRVLVWKVKRDKERPKKRRRRPHFLERERYVKNEAYGGGKKERECPAGGTNYTATEKRS